jgi:hypothetical protein
VCVEGREVQGPRVHVGGDDTAAVARCEDRLDPASGPDVERRLDRPSHGQLREGERRPVHARDLVGPGVLWVWRAPVGRDQQLVVRHDTHERPRLAAAGPDDTERLQALERQRGECASRGVGRDRRVEDEQLDDRAQRLDPRQAALVQRDVGRAGERLARRAERRADASPLKPAADSVAPSSAIAPGSPTSSGPFVTDALRPTSPR